MSEIEVLCFTIALRMGIPVEDVLDWDQTVIRRWQRFAAEHPFGFEADDYLFSKVCAVICQLAHSMNSKSSKTFRPSDFMRNAKPDAPMTDEEILAAAAQMKGGVLIDPGKP